MHIYKNYLDILELLTLQYHYCQFINIQILTKTHTHICIQPSHIYTIPYTTILQLHHKYTIYVSTIYMLPFIMFCIIAIICGFIPGIPPIPPGIPGGADPKVAELGGILNIRVAIGPINKAGRIGSQLK